MSNDNLKESKKLIEAMDSDFKRYKRREVSRSVDGARTSLDKAIEDLKNAYDDLEGSTIRGDIQPIIDSLKKSLRNIEKIQDDL